VVCAVKWRGFVDDVGNQTDAAFIDNAMLLSTGMFVWSKGHNVAAVRTGRVESHCNTSEFRRRQAYAVAGNKLSNTAQFSHLFGLVAAYQRWPRRTNVSR
jgi:hypothetical protein